MVDPPSPGAISIRALPGALWYRVSPAAATGRAWGGWRSRGYFEEAARAITRAPLRVEGSHIALPTDPGLGIDLDEDALARHPYREPSPRGLRRPADE